MTDIERALEQLRKVQDAMQVEFEQGADIYGDHLENLLYLVTGAIADLSSPIHQVLQEDGIRVLCSRCGKLTHYLLDCSKTEHNAVFNALHKHIDWCQCQPLHKHIDESLVQA